MASNLKNIEKCILEKHRDLEKQGFSKEEDSALTAFFDLAQETCTLEELVKIAEGVLKAFFAWQSKIHLFETGANKEYSPNTSALSEGATVSTHEQFQIREGSLFMPIRGNEHLRNPYGFQGHLIGVLEIKNGENLNAQEILFLNKFLHRVGCALHRRILAKHDSEHLRFISTLIADIEHNVIVPNMIFRLFLYRMHVKIKKNIQIHQLLKEIYQGEGKLPEDLQERVTRCLNEMEEVNIGLQEEYNNLEKHYKNTSLFLETLFRKSHFEAGTFVLKKRSCKFKKEIIDPQLERYLPRFMEKGIVIDNSLGGVPDVEIELVVDVGLISQVYANLFSNALKYTREVFSDLHDRSKYIALGWERLPGYFDDQKDGIKFNVFSTGHHVNEEEVDKIFEEGYRGRNSAGEPGTGHGLSFVKKVIQIHGGVVGYEPTPHGNNFYFILPVEN